MYRVLSPRPELLFLVEFEYECSDDEADFNATRGAAWWRDVRAPAAVKHPVLDERLLARCVPFPLSSLQPDWSRLTSISLAGRGIKVLGQCL